MELLTQINFLDLGIIAALCGGLYMGWRRGMIRQLLAIAAFYVALVVGAQAHRTLGGWIMDMGSGASRVIVDAFSFSVIFVLVLLVFNLLGTRVYKDTRIAFLKALDNVVGGILGVFTMVMELAIGLSILRFMVSVPWEEWDALRQQVVAMLSSSALQQVFVNAAPLLYALIRPWLPAGLPAIFTF